MSIVTERYFIYKLPGFSLSTRGHLKTGLLVNQNLDEEEVYCGNINKKFNMKRKKPMKKRIFILTCFCLLAAAFLQAETPSILTGYGDWSVRDGKLYQSNPKAGMAKAAFPLSDAREMTLKFKVGYVEGGVEDAHGGFGVHLYVDEPTSKRAWGEGESYLLWLNYDGNPSKSDIPAGLSAQVYKSKNNYTMELLKSYDLNAYTKYITSKDIILPLELKINRNSGRIEVTDPLNNNRYYYFTLPDTKPLNGKYGVLRTNGVALKFFL